MSSKEKTAPPFGIIFIESDQHRYDWMGRTGDRLLNDWIREQLLEGRKI